MSNEKNPSYEQLTIVELQTELRRLKDNLQDLEETHAFMFCRTTAHIGAEQARSMQDEHDEECRESRMRIARIDEILKMRG